MTCIALLGFLTTCILIWSYTSPALVLLVWPESVCCAARWSYLPINWGFHDAPLTLNTNRPATFQPWIWEGSFSDFSYRRNHPCENVKFLPLSTFQPSDFLWLGHFQLKYSRREISKNFESNLLSGFFCGFLPKRIFLQRQCKSLRRK